MLLDIGAALSNAAPASTTMNAFIVAIPCRLSTIGHNSLRNRVHRNVHALPRQPKPISPRATATLPVNPPQPTSPEEESPTTCGFIALLGASNSGKSTLLNRLVGQKIAIVTPRVQTTRCRIAGIATRGTTQLAFLDTPGIFEPGTRLARAMVKSAWRSGRDADVVALVIDAAALSRVPRSARRDTRNDSMDYDDSEVDFPDEEKKPFVISSELAGVVAGLRRSRGRGTLPKLCIVANKMDMVRGPARRERVNAAVDFLLEEIGVPPEDATVLSLSARTGDGVDELLDWAGQVVPKGPWLYDEDAVTDMPMRQLAAETVREACLLYLRHELPYEIAVETESFRERDDGSVRVAVDVLVARDSQKRIVTGRGGEMVKKIGIRAREVLAEMLGVTVHLFITVKVRPGWKEDRWQYEQWGLDYNS